MNQIQLLGVLVHAVTLRQAVQQIDAWLAEPRGACRYVVTPNLDHAVLLRERDDLRRAYESASLVIADGMPMLWASRLTGSGLKERVAGSDLVPAVLHRTPPSSGAPPSSSAPGETRKRRVFLLGAEPGVADRAAAVIHERYPEAEVVGTFSPELGFERDERKNAEIVERINAAKIDLLILGLGAPKQELWISKHAPALQGGVAICAGATIDFLAGHRQRAPAWMQRTGTEWLYRALSEPRRLVPRYAKDAYHLPFLLLQDWKSSRQ